MLKENPRLQKEQVILSKMSSNTIPKEDLRLQKEGVMEALYPTPKEDLRLQEALLRAKLPILPR
jgi:hypothetical protein